MRSPLIIPARGSLKDILLIVKKKLVPMKKFKLLSLVVLQYFFLLFQFILNMTLTYLAIC